MSIPTNCDVYMPLLWSGLSYHESVLTELLFMWMFNAGFCMMCLNAGCYHSCGWFTVVSGCDAMKVLVVQCNLVVGLGMPCEYRLVVAAIVYGLVLDWWCVQLVLMSSNRSVYTAMCALHWIVGTIWCSDAGSYGHAVGYSAQDLGFFHAVNGFKYVWYGFMTSHPVLLDEMPCCY